MTVLKVLICGGGIAGPALAFWLAKLGHEVTVVERSPSLRAQGQQIDIRGQAVEVCRRMGVLDTIRTKVVDEEGLRFEDIYGRSQALLLANKTGKGAQTFTSEYEIMRGDLCRVMYDASVKAGVSYRFDTLVTSFDQDEEAVTVSFADGTSDRFDLLVGADGQSSRLRRMMLPADEEAAAYKSLGVFFAYFTIPREPHDTNIAPVCNVPSRVMCLRTDNPKTTQAYLGIRPEDDATTLRLQRAIESRDPAQQKRVFTDLFAGAGWQASRILDEMNESTVAEDFYVSELAQIKSRTWSSGRVVLLGDAAHCPSPVSGMGTSSALVGAYVLAGELSRHCAGAATDGVPAALQAYDVSLRPFVDKVQKLPPGTPDLAFPRSWWGISVLHWVMWILAAIRLDKIGQYFASDDVPGYKLPDYPALKA